jgi:serine/threonine-protein kinase
MSLSPGTQLGSYRISAQIGAGGMGEVYRASDPGLKREVAIKVLPDEFVREPERKARFVREAQLLAALNHPNIAAVYGLEEFEGAHGLVLELVEGKTLDEMIEGGALPVEEALGIALQIAEALEAAHEKGIVHRDLKPANVKVTPDGKVKVLDFGLAKAFEGEAAGGPGDPSASLSPTLTVAATRAGVILGTAAYMSPEQAAGQAADRRADIWSFGVVLTEMLTGHRVFDGETVSHILASVLKDAPDWSRLPADLPPRILDLLKRCLHRKPRNRLQAIGEARLVLEEYLADPESFTRPAVPVVTEEEARPAWRGILPWTAAGLLAVALAVTLWGLWPRTRAGQPSYRMSLRVPENQFLMRGYGSSVAISPDGSRIAYVTEDDQYRRLYLRFLDQWEGKMILEADSNLGPYHPFFSPDGQWVGFVTTTEMKKVPVRGGSPMTLCSVDLSRGASWGPDGRIVFAPSPGSGLSRVSATGGEPEPLTTLDEEAGELSHRWPQILPGGEAILFTSVTEEATFDGANLELFVLETGERRMLHRGGSYGRYVGSGHIVYINEGTLLAFPFDLDRLEVTGSAAPVIEELASNREQVGAHFDVSRAGTLVHATGGARSTGTSLVWTDRQGNMSSLWEANQSYGNPVFSPDGTRLAVDIEREGDRDVWVYDLERDVPTRLTFADGDDFAPVWSPDGGQVYFASDRKGVPAIYRKASDGSGEAEPVLELDRTSVPTSISPDGRLLAYNHFPSGGPDVWILPLDGGEPEQFVGTPAVDYGAQFSPDGRWIAYGSNESGSFQVYVRPASGGRGKWQISTEIGTYPVWSPDGTEIFYRLNSGGVMSVQVEAGGGPFRASRPEPLFEGPFLVTADGLNRYQVAPDGGRLVMLRTTEGPTEDHEHLRVILNWFDELERTFTVPSAPSRR